MNQAAIKECYTAHRICTNVIQFPASEEQDPQKRAEKILAKRKRAVAVDSVEDVNKLVAHFLNRGQWRNALMVVMQLNTTFRIGDVRLLKWRHVLNKDLTVKAEWAWEEKKNKHIKVVTSNEALKKMIALYIRKTDKPIDLDSFIFLGRKENHMRVTKGAHNVVTERVWDPEPQPMDECSMNRIITQATKEIGLYSAYHHYTSHSNRKAAAVVAKGDMDGREIPEAALRNEAATEMVAQFMGHKNPSTTDRYIQTNKRMAKKLFLALNLGLEAIEEFEKKEGLTYDSENT